MPATRLDPDKIDRELETLSGWEFRDGALRRTYEFRDFVEAFAFMTAAALRVQEMDHHPEWSNVYGTVKVALVTHDAGGVTARDVELARRMEAIAERWPKR